MCYNIRAKYNIYGVSYNEEKKVIDFIKENSMIKMEIRF